MLEGRLDYKETQALHPKGNQVWIHIGKNNIEAETPILWPLDAKSSLIWKLLWFACECGSTGPQGPLPLNHDLQASSFQLCDTQHAGDWESCLPWRKERHPQRVSFQASICSKCFASQTSDLQACSKGLNSRVRAVCLPVHSKPCKHIPGSEWCCQWGRRLRECVWGGGCHAGVTWSRAPCTSNGPQARSYAPALCWRYPKARNKASSVRRRKTAMGRIFKQLLGHTVLGLPGRDMRILAPRPGMQGRAHGVFPAGSKNVPDRPRLTSCC